MKICVFGGAGFIGSHFVDLVMKDPEITEVLILDSLTYAGNMRNLDQALANPKATFVKADLRNPDDYKRSISNFDYLVNFAAESHVDRSISNPDIFASTNTLGVVRALNASMDAGVKCFVQVSTDEVYGSISIGETDEESHLNPSSPYSASKAAGDLLALSYWHTYKYPVIVTRGSNTYGERQFPEKLIPLALRQIRDGKPVPIYGNGKQMREWTFVLDHAEGIKNAMLKGSPGEIYNIGSGERLTNIELIKTLLKKMEASTDLLEYVQDRKGHDLRYALDSSKIKMKTGWSPKYSFANTLGSVDKW